MSSPVVCLLGPTASGKTALAIELVQRFPFEIISVDSAMIYQGMDIGSAKPSAEELALAPHHLIDIRMPNETYSVAEFCEEVKKLIQEIQSRGQIPLLVGGTMMYFYALREGLSPLPQSTPKVRDNLAQRLKDEGLEALYKRLHTVDSARASELKSTDTQRIMRALEVYEMTGVPMSQFSKDRVGALDYDMIFGALAPGSRDILHQNIERRAKQMFDMGLIDEVKQVWSLPKMTENLPSMRCVGYRQVLAYLKHEITMGELEQKVIEATRQLAKRQLTWLRKWPNLSWFDPCEEGMLEQVVHWLKNKKVI